MSKLFVLSAAACLMASVASAESQAPRGLLLKPEPPAKSVPKARAVTANPCAAFGPGFARVDGTDTCVKVGGAVRVETGTAVGR